MAQERRRMPRYRLETDIEVENGSGQTVDVSCNGIFFETSRRLVPGDEISLVLPFEHTRPGSCVRCRATVVRVERRGGQFGVAATYEPVAFNLPV